MAESCTGYENYVYDRDHYILIKGDLCARTPQLTSDTTEEYEINPFFRDHGLYFYGGNNQACVITQSDLGVVYWFRATSDPSSRFVYP